MKRSLSKGVGMTRTDRAKENVLDAEIQITLSEYVRSHQETKTKGILSEDLGTVAVKKKKKRPKMKRVFWLKHLMSKEVQNQPGCLIVSIMTDHGREFDNEVQFGAYCDSNGITHNFSAPRTPQSNGVVEGKTTLCKK
ncbi:retrovirus-related pol polyprotein from transposon TNT 1-94 [Tanacetum coccineum]